MDVKIDPRMKKLLRVRQEMKLIEALLERAAEDGSQDGAFLRERGTQEILRRLLALIRIEERDPENLARGSRRGLDVHALRREGNALMRDYSAKTIFDLLALLVLDAGVQGDGNRIRAAAMALTPHLWDAMTAEGMVPPEGSDGT